MMAYARSEGMGRVNHSGDIFSLEIGDQALDTAEPAKARLPLREIWRLRYPRERKYKTCLLRDMRVFSEQARLSCAAQYQDFYVLCHCHLFSMPRLAMMLKAFHV